MLILVTHRPMSGTEEVVARRNALARNRGQGANQGLLFAEWEDLRTQVITRRSDFDALFDGFTKMLAVSYVVSPDLLLEFFDRRGYTELEVIVGENLSQSYRQELEQKGIEVTERLAERVENGTLRIFVPDRTIHTKLYILEGPSNTRVIISSANLTETAREASRQTNYAWYADLPSDSSLLRQVKEDYNVHLQRCSLFMDDLKELLQERKEVTRQELIEVWLKGVAVEDKNTEIKQVFQELSLSIAQASDPRQEQTVAILQLPEDSRGKKWFNSVLSPLSPVSLGQNQLRVKSSDFVKYVYEMHRVPLLIFSHERHGLLLGHDTKMVTLTEEPTAPTSVARALEHIENYLNTVDFGESSDKTSVKTSMYEALLYLFFAPFAHEYMKSRRNKFGPMEPRGPRFLYIYGSSHNGKTTFLKFSLKLLTRQSIEPLSRQDFTKTKILNVTQIQTGFPLVFDDVDPSRTPGIEDVFKSYWERWWKAQYLSPQIIITSNTPRLREWAKSRVKRIDFDVHFAPNEIARERLAKLFQQDNPIFGWFSHHYIASLDSEEFSSDDELRLARAVMKHLYEYSGRSVPNFFPVEPVEKLYDPGRRDWRDLIYELRKASIKPEKNRILIDFSSDMQHWEINDYQGYLPQTIKFQRKGNTIIVENPSVFNKWLGKPPQTQSWFSRPLDIFRKK